jgi:hypothetical protein
MLLHHLRSIDPSSLPAACVGAKSTTVYTTRLYESPLDGITASIYMIHS